MQTAIKSQRLDVTSGLGGKLPSNSSARRVLVVDDSKMQRKILSSVLKRWNYHVIEAATGDQALELCKSHDPHMILSDWMMPGMSGLEFCEAYRQLELEAYGYFILLTSRSEKADIAQGLERGADDFLIKPVDTAELRGRIVAGERILSMQAVVNERNKQLKETLTQLQTVYRAIDRDLDEARRLQHALVPERFRSFKDGDVSLLLRPSGHVGGDLVGMFRVSENRIGLYSIDVAGHGIASALMTARLAGHLTGTSPAQNVALSIDETGLYTMRAPKDVCETLNRLICDEVETELYFTMLIADCDLRTGKVTMAQAGHPNPLLMRANGDMQFVGEGGMPIGLIETAEFSDFEMMLEPGDRLLIHSDGFTECPGEHGDMLDEGGLLTIAENSMKLPGPDFLESLAAQLEEYTGKNDFPDDVSAVLFDWKPDASRSR